MVWRDGGEPDACPCGGLLEPRMVEVRIRFDGDETVLTDVPQEVCPQCGSRSYRSTRIGLLESIMKGERPPRPRDVW